jgi:VanZ family protein
MTKLVKFGRLGAGISVLTIVILSVVPGNMRPHILGNDPVEHFVAYSITGNLLAVGYLRPMQLLASGVLLPVCAGLLELAQTWIPGRMPSAGEFTVSAIGTWVGLLAVIVVRLARDRRLIVS